MSVPLVEVDIPYAAAEDLARAGDLVTARAAIARHFAHLCTIPVGVASRPAAEPRRDAIGPWERREDRGRVRFVKRTDTPPGWWADVPEIAAAKSGRRVVLIGESVARTFLLDPLFTCARVLQSMCSAVAGEGAVEVVDLARNALSFDETLELVDRAAILDPDLYVVFAGNNVRGPFETSSDRPPGRVDLVRSAICVELARELLQQRSWRAIETRAAAFLERQARDLVVELARMSREQGVPLLYVIPAFNEQDWRAARSCTNPLLGAADQVSAQKEVARAEQLLDAGRIGDAESTLRQVLGNDGWLNPRALQLLAHAALARKMEPQARSLFRRAAEAVVTLPAPSFRQCTPTMATSLRAHGRAAGVALVDLSETFHQACGTALGRELFLDHVHMSASGVQRAMAAVAEAVLPLLGLPAQPRQRLLESAPLPPPDAVAQSHFLAAVFNATCDQSPELVEYHTARALEASPAILAAVELYVQGSVRRGLDLVCVGDEIARRVDQQFPGVSNHLGFARRLRHVTPVNHGLLRRWTDVLHARGIEVAPFETALTREYGAWPRSIDLLNAPLLDSFRFDLPLPKVRFAARRPESVFWFCWDGTSDTLRLRITTRVAASSTGKLVALTINEAPAQVWPGTGEWSTTECLISGSPLRTGVNLLRIDWPSPEDSFDDRLQRMAGFLAGTAPVAAALLSDSEMYPLFGEVCLLSASKADMPHPDLDR